MAWRGCTNNKWQLRKFIKSCLWLPWLKVKWLSRMHWPPYVTNIPAKIENHLHKHLDEIRDNDDGADASTAFVFASLPGWISLVEKKTNPMQISKDHKSIRPQVPTKCELWHWETVWPCSWPPTPAAVVLLNLWKKSLNHFSLESANLEVWKIRSYLLFLQKESHLFEQGWLELL